MMRESKWKSASDHRLKQKGSAMLEFAVVVVALVVMLFGVIDFGRALYTYHFVANAAREATRWASVNGATCLSDGSCPNGPASENTLTTYVRNNVPPGVDPTKVNVQACGVAGGSKCTGSPADCILDEPGCDVQVQLSYNFNFIGPLLHNRSITLSSNSETIISH